MGKNRHSKDRLYVTRTEYDRDYGGVGRKGGKGLSIDALPFDCCALSLRPFETPVCAPDGTVFDILSIVPFLRKHGKHPISGVPLKSTDLIKMNWSSNSDGKYHCPVTFKVFNDRSHIVVVLKSGNVYSYDAVKQLNIKAKNWTDLLDGTPFSKADIVSIQDPANLGARAMDKFAKMRDTSSVG